MGMVRYEVDELRSRWDYFCGKIWAKNRRDVFESLNAHYSDGRRFYHNWNHVLDCLRKLDEYSRSIVGHPDLFTEAAIWFHDVIYDTRRQDNEQRSAEFFEESWKILDVPTHGFMGESISGFIKQTKDHPSTCLVSGQVLFDIDLSILGAQEKAFDEYNEQIRAEYYWIDDDAFNRGRAEVLSQFLKRKEIYATEHFSKYEDQARENLTRAIKAYEER